MNGLSNGLFPLEEKVIQRNDGSYTTVMVVSPPIWVRLTLVLLASAIMTMTVVFQFLLVIDKGNGWACVSLWIPEFIIGRWWRYCFLGLLSGTYVIPFVQLKPDGDSAIVTTMKAFGAFFVMVSLLIVYKLNLFEKNEKEKKNG